MKMVILIGPITFWTGNMKKTLVVGLQYGDEGKGRVSHFLAAEHDWSIRFNGGPNAGHTVYQDDDGGIPAHVLVHGAGLRGKGFVGLNQVKILGLPAGFFQRLARGVDRPDAHDRRVQAGGGIGNDAGQRLDPALCRVVGGHQQGGGGAIAAGF